MTLDSVSHTRDLPSTPLELLAVDALVNSEARADSFDAHNANLSAHSQKNLPFELHPHRKGGAPLDLEWRSPQAKITLSRSEVHVWRVQLDPTVSRLQKLVSTLSAEEIKKADRFHSNIDRLRSLQSRGVLRDILGRYTQIKPSAIRLTKNSYDRPHLTPRNDLDFNVSHSSNLILIAIARERSVGVDIERLRSVANADGVAQQFFSGPENDFLQALPLAERQRAFFQCWTRKEAYVKALGTGLSTPLNEFTVSLANKDTPSLVINNADEFAWHVRELDAGDNYVAALAVETTAESDAADWHLACWDWTQ